MVTANSIGTQIPVEVAKGGTGIATTTAYSVICAGTTATGSMQSLASVGTSGQVLTSNGAAALPTWQASGGGSGGILLQQLYTSTNTVISTSGTIPEDATIPQNTEGDEILTLSITPASSSNILEITANFIIASNAKGVIALFQDSTANALITTPTGDAGSAAESVVLTYIMAAGTTSSTTFKIRAGERFSSTGNFLINNYFAPTASRYYGSTIRSYLTIKEYSV